jgi:3-oxoacyl-[acyl-carrier protein] reductase
MRLAREVLRRVMTRDESQRDDFNAVFISSAAGIEALGTALSYGSSKAALNHAAKELARLTGRNGVRVNVVAPGNFLIPGGTLEEKLAQFPSARNRLLKYDISLGRFGKPEELADVVVFIASPRAAYVTGVVWAVDGGQLRH